MPAHARRAHRPRRHAGTRFDRTEVACPSRALDRGLLRSLALDRGLLRSLALDRGLLRSLAALACGSMALAGCTNDFGGILAGTGDSGASSASAASTGSGGSTSSHGGAGGAASSSSSTSSTGGGGAGGSGGGGVQESRIWAHTKYGFFRYRPETDTLGEVIDFGPDCPDITNIAIDDGLRMFALAYDGALYTVDIDDGDCADMQAAFGSGTDSLAWAAAGVAGPEASLVAYDGAGYARIALTTNALTTVTEDALGDATVLDLTIPSGGASGWAVTHDGDCRSNDCLARIDAATGVVTDTPETFATEEVYGLAWYDGVAYGFHHSGKVLALEPGMAVTVAHAHVEGEPEQIVGAASAP